MRNGFLGSIAALAAGAGLAWGQGEVVHAVPQPVPLNQVAGPEILPVNGGVNVLAPPVSVIPAPGVVGPGGAPGYPPPAPFSLNDPNGPPAEPPLISAKRGWFNAEYIGWFITSQPVRYPFITTSNTASAGRLFQPTTSVLFTATDIPYNLLGGFRLSGGLYVDSDRRHGFETSFFYLQEKRKTFTAFSDPAGNPTLAVPFINALNGLNDAIVITSPNFASGGIRFSTGTQSFSGEFNLIANLYRSGPESVFGGDVTPYIGFRYFELEESLNLDTSSTLLTAAQLPAFAAFPPGTPASVQQGPRNLSVHDSFRVFNQIYAGNLGLRTEWNCGRWTTMLTAKVALGVNHTIIDTAGSTVFSRGTPAFTGSQRGGILATPDTDGRHHQDRFAAIPELTANIGYQISPRVSAILGYNLIYISDVIRVGDVVSPIVNPGVVPLSNTFGATPGVFPRQAQFGYSEIFLQGFNVGVSFKY